MNRRMERNRLNVGAYILQPYARTERHIREIKECGVSVAAFMRGIRPGARKPVFPALPSAARKE